MDREYKVKDILNELFYKDVSGIIQSYLFAKCKECDIEYLEENMKESFDNKFYCYRCIKKPDIRNCCKCEKYYSIKQDGIFVCGVCLKICCVYCSDCFLKNKVNLYTYHDNPHYAYYWLSIEDIIINLSDID